MSGKKLLGAAAILALFFALPAGADDRVKKLPEHHRKWLEDEVPYIISSVERETFLTLETEEQREAFVDAFWRKRDTNPSTLENEYKIEHYERLAYANEFFGRETFRPGWQTDRGRHYILLGKPTSRVPHEAKSEIYPAELWFYNNPDLKYVGLPPFFYLLFFQRNGVGEFQLYSPIADGPQALLTGYQTRSMDFRDDVERAYNTLLAIDPELAQASLSFRTDEGDIAQFQNPSFGTIELVEDIRQAPFYRLDTSYAERLDFERGVVESDYLFTFVPSEGMLNVLPGPAGAHYLHWAVELDAQHVAFVRDEDRGTHSSVFIASVEIVPRDDENRRVLDFRRESYVTLSEGEAKRSLHLPFAYSGVTPLVPGSYRARIILRNRSCPSRDESDCLKSYTLFDSEANVPEWSEEGAELSEIVLAYGTELPGGERLYRAFRFGNVEIFPNARRVYAIGDPLVVATLPRNAPPGSRVHFEVTDSVDSKLWLEKTVPVEALAEAPLVQELSLEGFEGGNFVVAATLLDAEGRSLSRRATPFTVSPRTAIARPGVRGSTPSIRPEIPGVVALALAEQYLELDEPEKARPLLEGAIADNPNLGPARERLAGILLDSGNDPEEVIDVLDPVYRNMPDRFEVLALLGEAYFQARDYARSAELFERAFALRRLEPRLLNLLAFAQNELGNLPRAIEVLERSLSQNPDQQPVKELLEKLRSGSRGDSRERRLTRPRPGSPRAPGWGSSSVPRASPTAERAAGRRGRPPSE